MTDISVQRLQFWNSRSSLGIAAGSGDINLKKLEIDALRNCIEDAASVLDAGCGNAFTLLQLSTDSDAMMFGFDYSGGMIESGRILIRQADMANKISICQGNLLDPPDADLRALGAPPGGFDLIYTERSIINLNNFEEQIQAVKKLWNLVASGGKLVLCEAFTDGLKEINYFRNSVGLKEIESPWHNRYLSLSEISQLSPADFLRPQIVEFSSTYYFVSRVINARLANSQGKEPAYDALINLQSMDLPPLDVCGQSKIIIFHKL